MGRLAFLSLFSLVACAAGFAKSGTFAAMPPSLRGINTAAPAYTSEDEKLVSEIAGSILNIAAFADRFEPGDPFQVRHVAAAGTRSKFSLARRAEVFTVELPGNAWHPASYVRLARSFMADGAGMSVSEDPATDRETGAPAHAAAETLARENLRLSRLLAAHPRSAALHERAALLLALVAAERATADGDIRPFLCRMTAHLAIARALHNDVLSSDGHLAERLLGQLGEREAALARPAGAVVAGGPVTFGDSPSLSILPAF